jgi:hypothetical protein
VYKKECVSMSRFVILTNLVLELSFIFTISFQGEILGKRSSKIYDTVFQEHTAVAEITYLISLEKMRGFN